MTDIFTLGIKADSTDIDRGSDRLDDFSKNADKAEKSTNKLRKGVNDAGKAIAVFGVASVAALSGISIEAANTAREITNLSRISGLTTEEFQRATFASAAFGIEQDKLADILKDVSDKVGDFLTTGAGPMVDFFEQIAPKVGVTADMFRDLNGKDALQLYISSIENANVSQNEMTFFMEAIASDAALLIPLLSDNGKEFERLADRADTLGIVLDDLDIENLLAMKTAVGELGAISDATSNIIGATLAPFVTDLTNRFNENSVSGEQLRDTMTDLVGVGVTITGVYADAGRAFEIFGTAIGIMAGRAEQGFEQIGDNLDLFSLRFELWIAEFEESNADWLESFEQTIADGSNALLEFLGIDDELVITTNTESVESAADEVARLTSEIDVLSKSIEDKGIVTTNLFKDAWQDVLDLMAEPLPSEGFDTWFDNMKKIIDQQRELQESIKKTGTESNKTTKIRASETTKWLAGAKDVSKGVALAFGENEKAQKAAFKLNQVIALAEQAMILSKIQFSNAETANSVANSAVKASANGTEAVTAAFAAPFPTGFVAGAAMIGIMASLGIGTGGGGGSVTDNGTGAEGTALGGGVSESLSNANNEISDILIDQLSELRGLRSDLNEVQNLSFGLFRQLLGVDPGHGEIRNRTERELEQSFRGLSGGMGGSFTNELSDIFDGVNSAINEALGTLGISTQSSLSDFIFNIGKISFDELSAEDAESRLNEILSAQSDLMVQSVAPFITQYQQLGEGVLETLVRVTKEQAFFNDHLARTGVILEGLNSVQMIEVNQNIIDLIGGFDNFKDASNSFFENFFTDVEQFEFLEQSITDVFDSLGLSMVDSREEFRALIEGIDITTEAGQALFAALLELVPSMDELFDTLEDTAAKELAEAERLLAEERRTAATELREAERLAATEARRIATELRESERLAATEARNLANAIKELTKSLTNAAKDSLSGLGDAIRNEQDSLRDKLGITLNGISDDFASRRTEIESRSESQMLSLDNQLGLVNSRISDLTSLSSALTSTLTGLSAGGRTSARVDIQAAINAGRSGQSLTGRDLQESIGILGNINEKQFNSALELQIEQAKTANELLELKDLTSGQLSQAEKNADLIEQQINTIERSANAQIEALELEQIKQEDAVQSRHNIEISKLDLLFENAQSELNELLGINSGVESLVDAQSTFAESINALSLQIAEQTATAQADANAQIQAQADANANATTTPDTSSQDEILMQLAVNSSAVKVLLDRWDGDGLPEERSA